MKLAIPCSDQCEGVANKVPTVQCGVCLLLSHPECVNWSNAGRDALFICAVSSNIHQE